MSEQFPFRFESHPKKKGICPGCGHRDKFRYYEDLAGNRLEDFGRCDRTSACGYWNIPSGRRFTAPPEGYVAPPEPKQIFPDSKIVAKLNKALLDQESPFHEFALSLGVSHEHLAKWRVGSETSTKRGHQTVYVHVNQYGQIVNAKWFTYLPTGKRDKDIESVSLKQPTNNEETHERYGLCIYGEHLFDDTRERWVMLVESEKSAVLGSWFYPAFDWAAVGSANGLTDAKIQVLTGRKVYWLADSDGNEPKLDNRGSVKRDPNGEPQRTEGGRKNSSLRKLAAYHIRHEILDLFPHRKDGYDIVDAIVDQNYPESDLAERIPEGEVSEGEDDDILTLEQADPQNQFSVISGLPKEHYLRRSVWRHYLKWGFIEYENAYFFGNVAQKDGQTYLTFKEQSNFVIRPLLLILSSSDPKRIFEVSNRAGDIKVKSFDPKQFSSPTGFSEVVESLGNFIFWGSKAHFIKIKLKLFEESREATEIKTLGYHSDGFYAFSNGIQNGQWTPLDRDNYGIVEHDSKKYFLPALSKIYAAEADEYQNHKLFVRREGTINFTDYAKRFCEVYHVGGNGRIGLLFYITCLFRDVVYAHFRFFPHLFLFGPPQSGKSSMAWSIMDLFGFPRTPFMLNTGTAVAFYKQFAEFTNAVVWFDEYKNTIDYARVQSLKTAYDGAGHTKSDNTRDNRNKSIPVKSGCIVSGQELPTADNALFTRCVLLQYTKTDYDQAEKDRHQAFDDEMKSKGVSHLTAQLSGLRQTFQETFVSHFDTEFAAIKKHFERRGIDDRITKNIAILLSTYQSLKHVLKFPFSEAEIRKTVIDIVSAQNALITGSKETSTFWKMVAFMHRGRQIKNKVDFRIDFKGFLDVDVPKGQPDQRVNLVDADHPGGKRVIMLRLANIHTLYQKLCRERGEKSMDEGSLRHYLSHQKGFLCKVRGIKFGKMSSTALAFDYEYLCEQIDDFNLDEWEDENSDDQPSEAPKKHSKKASSSEPSDNPF